MSDEVPLWQAERDGLSWERVAPPDKSLPQALSDSTPRQPLLPVVPAKAGGRAAPELESPPACATVDPTSPGRPRLISLDVFRGLAVVGMILVNNPGDPRLQSPWLAHARWNGLTLADLVFPFFLFSLGMALALTLGRDRAKAKASNLRRRLVRRSLILVGLGLLFHMCVAGNLSTFRIPGIFQRIGVCSLIAGLLAIRLPWKGLAGVALAILGGYSFLLVEVHAPSFAQPNPSAGWPVTELPFESVPPEVRPGYLSMAGSLTSYIDRAVFGRHTYRPEYDPEGVLSTFSAVSTVLIGILAGIWLGASRGKKSQLGGFFAWGGGLLALGGVAALSLPVNKALWSPSFVLVTGGAALILFALLEWCIGVHGNSLWFRPIEVFGANALVAYLGSNALMVFLARVNSEGDSLGQWVLRSSCFSWLGDSSASFCYGLLQVMVWLPPLWMLHRRRLYVRI